MGSAATGIVFRRTPHSRRACTLRRINHLTRFKHPALPYDCILKLPVT
jgi:hypothetical protein